MMTGKLRKAQWMLLLLFLLMSPGLSLGADQPPAQKQAQNPTTSGDVPGSAISDMTPSDAGSFSVPVFFSVLPVSAQPGNFAAINPDSAIEGAPSEKAI